jgi:hypothetical protein
VKTGAGAALSGISAASARRVTVSSSAAASTKIRLRIKSPDESVKFGDVRPALRFALQVLCPAARLRMAQLYRYGLMEGTA